MEDSPVGDGRTVRILALAVAVAAACEKPNQWMWDASMPGPNVERMDGGGSQGGSGGTAVA